MANQLAHVPRFRHPGNQNRNEDEPPPPQPVVNFWEEQIPGHGNGRQRNGQQRHGQQPQAARVPRLEQPGNPSGPDNPVLPAVHGPNNPVLPAAHPVIPAAQVPRLEQPGNPVPPAAQGPDNPVPPVARGPRLRRQPARGPRLQHPGNPPPPARGPRSRRQPARGPRLLPPMNLPPPQPNINLLEEEEEEDPHQDNDEANNDDNVDDDYVDIDRIDPVPFREEILPPPLFLGGITVRAEPGTNIRLFTLGSVDEEIDENDDNPRHCMFCLVNKAILSTSCCPTNPSVCKNCMHVLFVGKFVGRQCLNCQRYTVDYVLNSN